MSDRTTKTLQDFQHVEHEMLQTVERIERAEKQIEAEERRIISLEKKIVGSMQKESLPSLLKGGLSLREVWYLRRQVLRKVQRKQLLFSVLIIAASVLVWRGIWELSAHAPLLSSPLVALLAGLFLLWFLRLYSRPSDQ